MTAPNPPAGTDTGQQGTNTDPNAQQGSGGTGQQQEPPQGQQGGSDGGTDQGKHGDGTGTDLSKLSPEELVKEIEKWKGLSRKHEGDAKKGKAAEAELKKLQDAQLTQQERDAQKLKDAEARLATYELKERRVAAAEAVGLPAKWAARITGTTDEELAEQAQALKADLEELGAGAQQPPNTRQTAPNLRQGNRGGNNGQPPTANDFIRTMAGHRQ